MQKLLTINKYPQVQVDGIAIMGVANRMALHSFLELLCPISQIELQITRIKRLIKH